ncbi:MAG TPA: hypothetical protein VLB29_03005 [Nocardioidaceae bacterium]|nr:hypothetical protein [Nocardioidaceae bacterium]
MTTDPTTASLLRLEVGRLRAQESRRRFEPVVHVGTLGGSHRSCVVPLEDLPVLDAGTRSELIRRLLEHGAPGRPADVWLTRAGEPLVQDEDLAWLAATCRTFAALGEHLLGFWSITRTGWLDVRSGEQRTWKRLRL